MTDTYVENIFRVKMYAPRGFCLPPIFYSIHRHRAFSGSKRINMGKNRIYYIFEFKDIALNEQKNMRKFCRESMREDMIPISRYHEIRARMMSK